jgi:hypothetical protein
VGVGGTGTNAKVVHLPASAAQRALAAFRDEERAFSLVLEVLKEWRREELFVRVFTLYRARMRHLRKVASWLAATAEPRSAVDELRRFADEVSPRVKPQRPSI